MQKMVIVSTALLALLICGNFNAQAEPIKKNGMLVYKYKKSGDQHWTYGVIPEHSFRVVLPNGRDLKLKLGDDAVRGKSLDSPVWKSFLKYKAQ